MKANRRWFFVAAILLVVLFLFASYSRGDGDEARFQWNLISVAVIGGVPTLQPGGTDTAKAPDNSVISLTGAGTFMPGEPNEVTGGGTWLVTDATGHLLGTGTYQVTRLVRFDPAPGSIPAFINDTVGDRTHATSGLVFLAIHYSDGSRGILVVSCMLPVGSPASMFEGVTASKGFVDFFNHASGNTLFHQLSEEENQGN
jgi:hypothetical protein